LNRRKNGEEPRWAPDGRALSYRHASFLEVVPIQTGETLQATEANTVFNDVFDLRSNSGMIFDVSPRDGRILLIRPPKSEGPSTIKVVLNWFGELHPTASSK